MSKDCAALDPFLDGELSEIERKAFRIHLAGCEPCQEQLTDSLHLIGIESTLESEKPAKAPAPTALPRASGQRRRRTAAWVGTAGLVAAAAVLALVLAGRDDRDAPRDSLAVALDSSPHRSIEPRFGAAGADHHRPYAIERSSAKATRRVPLDALVALEKGKAWSSLVAGHAINGEISAARAALLHLEGAVALSDASALDLLEGRAKEALINASLALKQDPALTSARWNRALALRELGLVLAAADELDRVSAQNEPGWAGEARTLAESLRRQYERRRERWNDAGAAIRGLIETGAPPPAPLLSTHPWLVIDALYRRVLSGSDPEALAPERALATQLGARTLVAFIDRANDPASAATPSRRKRFHELLELEPSAFTLATFDELDEIAALFADPFAAAAAIEKKVYHSLYIRRDYAAAFSLASSQEATCAADSLAMICSELEALRGIALASIGRGDLAIETLERVLSEARRREDWSRELASLYHLGEAMLNHSSEPATFVVADALIDEQRRRAPSCAGWVAASTKIASWLVRNNRWSEAREELASARIRAEDNCPLWERTISGLLSEATIAAATADGDLAKRVIADLDVLVPEVEATLDRELLEIARAEVLLLTESESARRVLETLVTTGAPSIRRRASEMLALAEAGTGRWEEVKQRLSLGPCTVVALADRRVAAIVVDAAGQASGELRWLDEGERPPLPRAVFSEELRTRLKGCTAVEAVASHHYYGQPDLLPRDVALFFRSSAGKRDSQAAVGPKVYVGDIDSPPGLGLARLRSDLDHGPDAIVIEGPAATPTAVSRAIGRASYVEIHAHGITNGSGNEAIVLSAERDGNYMLTADALAKLDLAGHPIVVLAACNAGQVAGDEPWGLAQALLIAGASAVVASPAPILDRGVGAFFAGFRRGLDRGDDVAVALRRSIIDWRGESDWPHSLVVFQ